MSGPVGSAVLDPGWYFRITTVITIVGGTLFLMWLGEQITARGVGNGISLIIFTGIIAQLPRALASTLELGRTGALSTMLIIFLLFMVVAVITFIVFMERAPAPHPGAVSQTPAGQPHVRRRELASAAQDQRLRRDPADLRELAAADAGDHGELRRRRRAGVAGDHHRAARPRVSRCTCCCTSA